MIELWYQKWRCGLLIQPSRLAGFCALKRRALPRFFEPQGRCYATAQWSKGHKVRRSFGKESLINQRVAKRLCHQGQRCCGNSLELGLQFNERMIRFRSRFKRIHVSNPTSNTTPQSPASH